MKHSVRQRAGVAAVAALVITAGIGVNSLTASGSVAIGNTTVPYGTLTIDLTTYPGVLRFVEAGDDAATFTQALGISTPCSTIVAGQVLDSGGDQADGTLLTFSATGGLNPNPQLPNDGIGVTDGANCGTPAGLVGPNQTLTVELGDFFDEEVTVSSASLVIGKNHQQDGSLQLGFDGGELGGPIPIARTGQTVQVNTPFDDSITLASTASQNSRGLSLKGPTVFNLAVPFDYDEAVPCGGTVEGVDDGNAATSADFYRGLNGPDGDDDDCEDIGVTLRIRDGDILLDKSTSGIFGADQDVNATLTIEWAPVDPMVVSNPSDVLSREINFTGDPDDPYYPVQWCLSYDEDSVTADHPDGPEGINHPFENEEVPWCLVSNTETFIDGKIVQVQVYHGKGDPSWK